MNYKNILNDMNFIEGETKVKIKICWFDYISGFVICSYEDE